MPAIRTQSDSDEQVSPIFPCDVCFREFSRRHDLNRHMKTHDPNAKVFCCDYAGCGFSARQKSNLVTHIRTHTHERPLTCPDDPRCPFHTSDPSLLTRHRKRKHGHVPARGGTKIKKTSPAPTSKPSTKTKKISTTSVSKSSASTKPRRLQVPKPLPIPSLCPSLSSSPAESRLIGLFPATPTALVTDPEIPCNYYNGLPQCSSSATPLVTNPEVPCNYYNGLPQYSSWDLNYPFAPLPKMTYPANQTGTQLENFVGGYTGYNEMDLGMNPMVHGQYDTEAFSNEGYFTNYSADHWANYQLDPLTSTSSSDLTNSFFPNMMNADISLENNFNFMCAPPVGDMPLSSVTELSLSPETDVLAAAMDELFMAPAQYPMMSF